MKNATNNLYWRQNLGRVGESYVVKLLIKKGWQVIERNWRAGRYAEIDIIAYDLDKILVFIEVKTRMATPTKSGFSNLGYDKLDKIKTKKLLGCAQLYMAKRISVNQIEMQGCRFDAFVICYPLLAAKDRINILEFFQKAEPEIQHIMGFIQ